MECNRHFFTAALFGLLCLQPSQILAGVFSRSDDTRPAPPEVWASRDGLNADVSLGGTYLAGNVDHVALNARLGLNVELAAHHELFLEGNASYAAFAENPVLDKDSASLLYAFGVSDHLNLFFYSTHSHNRFLQLDYRMTNSLGVCLHSFLGEGFDTALVSLGATPEIEWWSDGTRQETVRASLRLKIESRVNEHFKAGVDALFAPTVTRIRDYRVYAEAYVEVKLTDELVSLRLTATDEFDSRPRRGIKRNDLSVVPAIVVHTAN